MTQTQTIIITLNAETCCNCGVVFGLEAGHQKRLRNNREWFYCPNGHAQHYTGKSEAQKLKDQLAKQEAEAARRARDAADALDRASARELATRDQLEATQRSRAALKGQLTKTKRRIGKGVCPCCNRHFANVDNHMQSQHPDYATETPS